MIMCVLLCYPVSIHMSQLLSTGRPISSFSLCSHFLILTFSFLRICSGPFSVPTQSQSGT